MKAYISQLEQNYPQLQNTTENSNLPILEKYNHFINFFRFQFSSHKTKLSTHLQSSIGKNFFTKLPAPWWTEICDQALQNRKNSMRKYKKDPSLANFINYKKFEVIAKKTFKKEKWRGWRIFCESLLSQTSLSTLWKIIKRYKNRFLNPLSSPLDSNYKISDGMLNVINNICPSFSFHFIYTSIFDISFIQYLLSSELLHYKRIPLSNRKAQQKILSRP